MNLSECNRNNHSHILCHDGWKKKIKCRERWKAVNGQPILRETVVYKSMRRWFDNNYWELQATDHAPHATAATACLPHSGGIHKTRLWNVGLGFPSRQSGMNTFIETLDFVLKRTTTVQCFCLRSHRFSFTQPSICMLRFHPYYFILVQKAPPYLVSSHVSWFLSPPLSLATAPQIHLWKTLWHTHRHASNYLIQNARERLQQRVMCLGFCN